MTLLCSPSVVWESPASARPVFPFKLLPEKKTASQSRWDPGRALGWGQTLALDGPDSLVWSRVILQLPAGNLPDGVWG